MRLKILILAFLLVFLLTACYDYNELNMQELVSGVGVDAEGDLIRVTVQCAETSEDGGSIYNASGESFFDAIRNISLKNPKKLWWGHTEALIIGKDAFEITDSVFDAILRAHDIHLDIIPVFAKGATAKELTEAKSANGDNAPDAIFSAFANERNSRRFFSLRLWELLREKSGHGLLLLPAVELQEGQPAFAGGAVLRGRDAPIFLTTEQMLLLSLLTDEGGGGYLPPIATSDNGRVSFEILARSLKQNNKKTTLELVLSPAEAEGKFNSENAKAAAERWLDEHFEAFNKFLSENGLTALTNGVSNVRSEVTISNILGGRQ